MRLFRRLPTPPAREQSTKPLGQALVETALLLPILLILLLGAIDFGRLFFGWVNLHQTARIGANFAATHPDVPTDDEEQEDLVLLIGGDTAGLNCDPDADEDDDFDYDDLELAFTSPDGTATADPTLGDYASLSMECNFSLLIPLSGVLFGDPISMTASSTFPVREGCVNCPEPAPVPPPPTPEQCRLKPEMEGLSVEGARLAWTSAGFDVANFTPSTGDDTSTVTKPITVTEDDPDSTCVSPYAIFSSSVIVTILKPESVSPGCATVPNLMGVSVGDARIAWDVEFDILTFTPATGDDSLRVASQETSPASTPGVSCLDLTATINVVPGAPLPPPPPRSCPVPSMINSTRAAGEAKWVDNGFAAKNFSPPNGNFTIESQSLVGGEKGQWQLCTVSITVSASPGG